MTPTPIRAFELSLEAEREVLREKLRRAAPAFGLSTDLRAPAATAADGLVDRPRAEVQVRRFQNQGRRRRPLKEIRCGRT